MAGSRLITKILADFLFGFYLLTFVLKYATNHTQNRCGQFEKKLRSIKKLSPSNILISNNLKKIFD